MTAVRTNWSEACGCGWRAVGAALLALAARSRAVAGRDRRRSAAARSSPPSRAPPTARSAANQTRLEPGRLQGAGRPASGALHRRGSPAWAATRSSTPTSAATAPTGSPTPPSAPTSAGSGSRSPATRTRATSGARRSRPTRRSRAAPTATCWCSSATAATCSRCTPPTTSAGRGHRWTAGSTARFNLRLDAAAPRRLDVGRRGGAPDPARAGALRRGQPRPRPPRDPGHLRRDAPRLHPPRHPLRLGPLRPEPAADGPAAAALERLLPRQPRTASRPAASRG